MAAKKPALPPASKAMVPVTNQSEAVIMIEVRYPLRDLIQYGEGMGRTLDDLRAYGSAEVVGISIDPYPENPINPEE